MMKKKPETAEKHDKAVDSEKQPLLYHLMGLRTLLMHWGAAILIGFIATFYFLCEPLMNFIIDSTGTYRAGLISMLSLMVFSTIVMQFVITAAHKERKKIETVH